MSNSFIAYCWRNGKIQVGRSCPKGAKPLASGPEKVLRKQVAVRSRHAYSGRAYLVPGVPEADTEEDAKAAVSRFIPWLVKGNDRLRPEAD